jgi:hypothetical protein
MDTKKKKASSYLDELNAAHDATTPGIDGPQEGKAHQEEVAAENNWGQDQRDAIGRAASLAAKKKIVARKLRRIAAEIESLSKEEEAMDGDYKGSIEAMQSEIEEKEIDEDIEEAQEADSQDSGDLPEDLEAALDEPEDLSKMTDADLEEAMASADDMTATIAEVDKTDPMEVEMGTDPAFMEVVSSLKVKAEHPLMHDPAGDDPAANASSQMGDEEWINIGPGSFDDARDVINKPAKVAKKKN